MNEIQLLLKKGQPAGNVPISQNFYDFVKQCNEILKSREKILRDFKPSCLKSQEVTVFKGMDLVNYLMENYNPHQLPKECLTHWVGEIFANAKSAHQLIYHINLSQKFQDSNELYRFFDDQLLVDAQDPKVLNLNFLRKNQSSILTYQDPQYFSVKEALQMSRKIKSFYQEQFLKEQLLLNSIKLTENIQNILMKMKSKTITEDGMRVDYEAMKNLKQWKEQFIPLLELLPLCSMEILLNNYEGSLAFFINIYNILMIHSMIAWHQLKGSFNLSFCDRQHFFEYFKYNIGGVNYTLDDLEHGILRGNDKIGQEMCSKFFKLMSGKSLTDQNGFRYGIFDPRRKIGNIFRPSAGPNNNNFIKKEPRIHFTLNCGAQSCAPIKTYETKKISRQLEVAATAFIYKEVQLEVKEAVYIFNLNMIFKWYQSDFAADDIGLLNFIAQYAQEEIKQAIDQITLDSAPFQIKYVPYDWDSNYGQNIQNDVKN